MVLKPARKKLAKLAKSGESLPVNLRYASITDSLPYPDNFFDGIGANLILPYVIDFKSAKGKKCFRRRPPGNVQNFETRRSYGLVNPKAWSQLCLGIFIVSIPDMLNVYEYIIHKDVTRILQGTRILRHALTIQRKRKEGIYTFLSKKELKELLLRIGFINPVWEKTLPSRSG